LVDRLLDIIFYDTEIDRLEFKKKIYRFVLFVMKGEW